MSPKTRRTEGGQSCPLDREEPEGDKIVPEIEKSQRGTKMSPKKRRTEGDKIVP